MIEIVQFVFVLHGLDGCIRHHIVVALTFAGSFIPLHDLAIFNVKEKL